MRSHGWETASLFFPPEDPFHHIPFMDVSSFSTEKGFVFRYYLPGTVQKNPRYPQQPFKFSYLELLSSQSLAIFILRLLSSPYTSCLFPTYRKRIHSFPGLLWSHVTHYPNSQALFTCSPCLVLHFPFLRLPMSISVCTPLLYSTSNPAFWSWGGGYIFSLHAKGVTCREGCVFSKDRGPAWEGRMECRAGVEGSMEPTGKPTKGIWELDFLFYSYGIGGGR